MDDLRAPAVNSEKEAGPGQAQLRHAGLLPPSSWSCLQTSHLAHLPIIWLPVIKGMYVVMVKGSITSRSLEKFFFTVAILMLLPEMITLDITGSVVHKITDVSGVLHLDKTGSFLKVPSISGEHPNPDRNDEMIDSVKQSGFGTPFCFMSADGCSVAIMGIYIRSSLALNIDIISIDFVLLSLSWYALSLALYFTTCTLASGDSSNFHLLFILCLFLLLIKRNVIPVPENLGRISSSSVRISTHDTSMGKFTCNNANMEAGVSEVANIMSYMSRGLTTEEFLDMDHAVIAEMITMRTLSRSTDAIPSYIEQMNSTITTTNEDLSSRRDRSLGMRINKVTSACISDIVSIIELMDKITRRSESTFTLVH
ncbi:hypothetical protein DL767_002814 [Monosporascus sp. MG133]|nr:hypothetical protein DL767_002814 [Monosporascus sp. MG133]